MKSQPDFAHEVQPGFSIDGITELAIFRLAPDGTIVSWNEGAKRLIGYAADEIVGCNFAVLRTPPDAASGAPANALSIARKTGRFVGAGWRVRRDGSLFWASDIIEALRDVRGALLGFANFSRDETERRAEEERSRASAEGALASANGLLTMAEGLAHCGHWHVDLASQEVFWSDETYRIHGLPKTHTPSMEDIAAFDPDGPDIDKIVARALGGGRPYTFESRVRRPDGTWRDVLAAGHAERGSDGSVTGLAGILLDTTESRRSEAALRSANNLMKTAEEMTHCATWQVDFMSGQTYWSDEMYRIFKRPAPAPPALEDWIATFDPRGADVGAIVLRAALDGKPYEFETRIGRDDGSWCAVRVKGRGRLDRDGQVVGIVGVLQDISERKDAERERKVSMTFQRAVLPAALPQVTGCTFDAVYEPGRGDAGVGGDWYDAFTLVDGRILVSIGDVAGGGLEAAVIVGAARQVMRGIAQLHPDPTLILDAADRALSLEYPDVYVSTWVGAIDLAAWTVTYASAGHPPPVVVSRDGRVRELDDPSTLLIGLREGHTGRTNVVHIEPGDTLVLYTDGVTEAGRDVIAGTRALHDAAATLAAADAHPADAIRRRVIPEGSIDDVAILVVRTHGAPDVG